MIRYLLTLFLLASTTFASVDSLKGTAKTFDSYLQYSTATLDSFNYGGSTGQLEGYTNSLGTFNGMFLFGADVGAKVDTIATHGETVDSIVVALHTYTIVGSNAIPRVGALRAPTNWIEGTNTGTYTSTMSSFKYRGSGTGWTGETVTAGDWGITYPSLVDSIWDFYNNASNPSSLFRFTGTEPFVSMTDSGTWTWNVTTQFMDSINADRDYVAILFVDTVWTHSGAQHDRWSPRSSETSVASLQPTIYFYSSVHILPDSTWLRINVTVPAGTVTNMPVLVDFLTYPANANNHITFYAVDSTTKLYWYPDSASGHYHQSWVRGNWAGGTDTIFVRRISNPSYMNADSVFLLYEDFNTEFQVTKPCSAVTVGTRVARDTVNGGTPYLDVLAEGLEWSRENSNICSTGNGYVQVICGGFTDSLDANTDPQDSTFGFVFRSPTINGTYTNEGMIVVSRSAPHAEDTIRIQDAYLMMDGDTLRMVFEDKRINTVIGSYDVIGQMVSADDGATWAYRGVLIDTSFWDSDEGNAPSSPVLWKVGNIYYLAGEGKNGNYTENSVVKSTEGGAIYMAYCVDDIYNPIRWHPDEDGTDFELPAIPYAGGYNYACVPDAHWTEGTKTFLSAHTQNTSGSSWGVSVWSINTSSLASGPNIWTLKSEISNMARFWGDSSITNRALADDPQPMLIDGNFYMNTGHLVRFTPDPGKPDTTIDTVFTMNLAPVIAWDTTGNPYSVTWWKKEALGATGYAHVTDGILNLVPEPYSERNSVGIVTVDSFQTNVAVDIRYRFPYPSHRVYTSFSIGNGNPVSYVNTGNPTAYEVTNLADGYHYLFSYGVEEVVPGVQPVSANRIAGTSYAAPTYSATNWNNFSYAVVGNGTADSVYSGFGYSPTNFAKNDTMDVDYKRLGIFAGTYLYNLTNGGVEVDRMQVRKYVSGGFSTQASDTLEFITPSEITGTRNKIRSGYAGTIRSQVR